MTDSVVIETHLDGISRSSGLRPSKMIGECLSSLTKPKSASRNSGHAIARTRALALRNASADHYEGNRFGARIGSGEISEPCWVINRHIPVLGDEIGMEERISFVSDLKMKPQTVFCFPLGTQGLSLIFINIRTRWFG